MIALGPSSRAPSPSPSTKSEPESRIAEVKKLYPPTPIPRSTPARRITLFNPKRSARMPVINVAIRNPRYSPKKIFPPVPYEMFNSASMEGRVEPFKLSVNPKTKNVRKQPAVSRMMVVFDGLVFMMSIIKRLIIGLLSLEESLTHKKYPKSPHD